MLGIDHSLRQIMISRDSHRNGHRKRRTIQPFGSRHHRCCGWSSGASKTILVHLHRLGGRRPWLEQTGSDGKTKIRRGEDWRRSGHNATCIMHDQPFHHPYWHASNTTTTDHSKLGTWPRRSLSTITTTDPRQAHVLLLAQRCSGLCVCPPKIERHVPPLLCSQTLNP